jgi:hypothetical protein
MGVDVTELRDAIKELEERLKSLDETVSTMQPLEFAQLHKELSDIRATVLAIKQIADALNLFGVAVRWIAGIAAPVMTVWYLWKDHR